LFEGLINTRFLSHQFNQKQLENLVDGVMAIGDKNGDKRIHFEEFVAMSSDTFVVNFAPNNLKKLFRY
jgi:Ca2+-binding EF-hand superfamily protein